MRRKMKEADRASSINHFLLLLLYDKYEGYSKWKSFLLGVTSIVRHKYPPCGEKCMKQVVSTSYDKTDWTPHHRSITTSSCSDKEILSLSERGGRATSTHKQLAADVPCRMQWRMRTNSEHHGDIRCVRQHHDHFAELQRDSTKLAYDGKTVNLCGLRTGKIGELT